MQRSIVTGIFALALAGGVTVGAEAKTHVVARGETLIAIAKNEGVAVADLARFNQLEGSALHKLSVGQELALDEVAADRQAPVAEATDVAPAYEGADVAMWSAPPAEKSPSSINRLAHRIAARTSSLAMGLTRSAMRFIGVPYSFGGTSASGFDCSGYTQHVFAMLGIRLPRTADAQYFAGSRIQGQMAPGDLVFFQTYEPGPSHVGIYVGNGQFVHSSSSHGVMVSHLRDSYWSARYLGAKRVLAAR